MTDLEEIVRELKPSVLIGAAAIPKVNYLRQIFTVRNKQTQVYKCLLFTIEQIKF